MGTAGLRHLLVTDWAEIENTPKLERSQNQIHLWHRRAERLAGESSTPLLNLVSELKSEARDIAAGRRDELLVDLARELAVCRALSRSPAPPWRRRLARLVQVSNDPPEAIRERVEETAAGVSVVMQG